MGFLYVLSNASMPGLLKIGRTNDLKTRMSQLSSPTSIPTPFKLEAFWESPDPKVHESRLFEKLKKFRVSNSREFFRVNLVTVRSYADALFQPQIFENEAQYRQNQYDQYVSDKQKRRAEFDRLREKEKSEGGVDILWELFRYCLDDSDTFWAASYLKRALGMTRREDISKQLCFYEAGHGIHVLKDRGDEWTYHKFFLELLKSILQPQPSPLENSEMADIGWYIEESAEIIQKDEIDLWCSELINSGAVAFCQFFDSFILLLQEIQDHESDGEHSNLDLCYGLFKIISERVQKVLEEPVIFPGRYQLITKLRSADTTFLSLSNRLPRFKFRNVIGEELESQWRILQNIIREKRKSYRKSARKTAHSLQV